MAWRGLLGRRGKTERSDEWLGLKEDDAGAYLLSRIMIMMVAMAIHNSTATMEPATMPIGVLTENTHRQQS